MAAVILRNAVKAGITKDELDNLVQAEAVSGVLEALGLQPVYVDFSSNIDGAIRKLKKIRPEIVFNLVESIGGAGEFIHFAPTVLDFLKIPYTGCPTESLFITSNKLLSKKFLSMAGIPTAEWVTPGNIRRERSQPNLPWIIKSVWEHASIGLDDTAVVNIKNMEELGALIDKRTSSWGGHFFAERFIEGRELNVALLSPAGHGSVLSPEVLPTSEMRFLDYPEEKPRIVSYSAKWDRDSFEYLHTERCFSFNGYESSLLSSVSEIALACWEVFCLNGYARVDFRVDGGGNPYVLEVNANPCIAPDSGYVAAVEEAGYSYSDLIGRIVANPVMRR